MGFLGLCDLVSKKRHKATTPNGVPQVKEHDIFQTELIQWLGSVRSGTCRALLAFGLIWLVKERHKATTPNGISQSINAIIKMYRNDDIRMYKFHYISDTICMR